MIRMARVGVDHVNNLADPDIFVRAVHVTGDLENLGQGTPDDQRYFVTVADERHDPALRLVLRRQRAARQDRPRPAAGRLRRLGVRQVPRRAVHAASASPTSRPASKYHICGGFPSASGKTNLAMMLPPDALGDRYHVEFYGDDIAWLLGRPEDGKLYGDQPGVRRVRRRQGHQRADQPDRARRDRRGHRHDLHQRRLQREDPRGLVGGPHARAAGRHRRLAGLEGRAHRRAHGRASRASRGRTRTAGSPRRWPTSRTSPRTSTSPKGVPIDAIIFGGRTRDREPLVRAITDVAEGVYDGLTLGAEATFAAEGVDGPAALRPDVDAAVHVLPRGRLRRALAEDHRRGGRDSRSSPTSTGSSATPRTGTSCGPGTARTCARCCG